MTNLKTGHIGPAPSGLGSQILVVPRESLPKDARFLASDEPGYTAWFSTAAPRWLRRPEAEVSETWVQPIPCAVIKSDSDSKGYCVLRRVRQARRDLNSRLTLIVGGHVDRHGDQSSSRTDMESLLIVTLRKELKEELGVTEIGTPRPLGLVVDTSSLLASRHIAVVYEIELAARFVTLAREEFSVRSKYTGQFFNAKQLDLLRSSFDPWSRILFEDYISAVASLNVMRQPALPLHLPVQAQKRER